MLDELLGALAASPVATALRASRVVYPVVNALHILGLAALFGAILALDLRLLGAARSIPAEPLARYLPRVAAAGLGTAVLTGLALFTVQPADYIGNRAFLLKVALVASVRCTRSRCTARARGSASRRAAAWSRSGCLCRQRSRS